jgi:hypothetical protein
MDFTGLRWQWTQSIPRGSLVGLADHDRRNVQRTIANFAIAVTDDSDTFHHLLGPGVVAAGKVRGASPEVSWQTLANHRRGANKS